MHKFHIVILHFPAIPLFHATVWYKSETFKKHVIAIILSLKFQIITGYQTASRRTL